jgi:MerR family transcriptional regulator, redox-sensitive transcriptional activator SoxR
VRLRLFALNPGDGHDRSSSALEVKLATESNMKDALTIGDLAKRSGVAPSALRFYEERKLIHSERNVAGHRRYPRAVLRRIAFIVFAQRIGLTLQEVAQELGKLPKHHVPTAADWAKLSSEWKQRIDERIDELQRLRDGLMGCIGCGCLSLKKCRLANPNDRAAAVGAGPAAWTMKR